MLQPQTRFPFTWSSIFTWILWALALAVLIPKVPVWWGNFQAPGKPAPVLELTEMSSKQIFSIPPNAEQPAVLIFWATWCGPCHFELSRIQKAIDDRLIPAERVFAISLGEELSEVERFVREKNYTFSVYLDPQNLSRSFYTVQGTPTIYHIQSGKILWTTTGVSPLSIQKAESLFKK